MINYIQLLAIIGAGVSVGLADALIKKIAVTENAWAVFKNPWMMVIILLYLFQIVFFIYVFKHNWKLGIAGNAQMLFYSMTVVISGFFIFKESISIIQMAGIVLAIIAVFLINQ
jgi:drug/metabolite transporter (DMT)-like permease